MTSIRSLLGRLLGGSQGAADPDPPPEGVTAPVMDDALAGLGEALGHRFADRELLERALTHSSVPPEQAGAESNERLEFLGDAVLGLIVAERLHEDWDLAEGEMSKVRAAVVNKDALASVARQIGLSDHLRLGKGERAAGGSDKKPILADAMEALIGAVYLDAGFDAARRVVMRWWSELIEERAKAPGHRDYKTRLQEVLARRSLMPAYRVEGSGPDHARTYRAEVEVEGTVVGRGEGRSKKAAEQDAARIALEILAAPDA